MSENEFTKRNKENGIPMQTINDAGLNPFGLLLLIESFTKAAGDKAKKVDFVFRGVRVQLEIATQVDEVSK